MQLSPRPIWKQLVAVALFAAAGLVMRACWISDPAADFGVPVSCHKAGEINSSSDDESCASEDSSQESLNWVSEPFKIELPNVISEPVAAISESGLIDSQVSLPLKSKTTRANAENFDVITWAEPSETATSTETNEPAIPIASLPKFQLEETKESDNTSLPPTRIKTITNPYFLPDLSDASDEVNPSSFQFDQAEKIELSPATPTVTPPSDAPPPVSPPPLPGSNDFQPRSTSAASAAPSSSESAAFSVSNDQQIVFASANTAIENQPAKSANDFNSAAASYTSPSHELGVPNVLSNADKFVLAPAPPAGAHWKDDRPLIDRRAVLTEPITHDFSADPIDQCLPYDAYQQIDVYEGKTLNATQRPILELGRPWYQLGQLAPPSTRLGKHNPINHQFLIYGDIRTAISSNKQNGNSTTQTAYEVNLDFDWQITSTERFHAFWSPLDNGVTNTGYVFDDEEWTERFDANVDFGYFESDLGAIVGGAIGKTLPFDFPFAMGVMPLVLQNGVWMEDAFLGVAATIPARNSARLDISNMDITFFAGFDKITSDAFRNNGGFDDSAAKMYGIASFIEALDGYFEIDYAFLEDRTFNDRSYHNLGFGYTRRYGRWISNSTRMIVNAGQSTQVVENTADGVLLLSENSLITGSPSSLVPYMNFFAGFDRPQSVARAAQSGGILRNTGILFESDGMTNYPTLDPTANDTFGGALGLNLLANDFSQQLVVEAAWLNVMGDGLNRNAPDSQYGLGMRYQLPLTNALIFRADAMVGFLEDASDIHGARMELRHKY